MKRKVVFGTLILFISMVNPGCRHDKDDGMINYNESPLVGTTLCPRRDSNPHHQNRNLTFYPLNYEDLFAMTAKIGK
jgi:hypothetical protein